MAFDDIDNTHNLHAVWAQRTIPVIERRDGKGERPRVRLPRGPLSHLTWLRTGHKITTAVDATWNGDERVWEIPKAWLNDTIERAIKQWGSAYMIQPYNENEVCAPACWDARGHTCSCSCGGAHHGQGEGGLGWCVASDTFAARSRGRHVACRLLTYRA